MMKADHAGVADKLTDASEPVRSDHETRIRTSVVGSAAEAARLKAEGALDRPTYLAKPIVDAMEINAAKRNILVGDRDDFDLRKFVTDSRASQARIAKITAGVRESFGPPMIPPRLPSAELVAMQGIRDAIVAQGEFLEEQVAQTVRLAELQDEGARVQSASNSAILVLTGVLVVLTSVLVTQPFHYEWLGLTAGISANAVLLLALRRRLAKRRRETASSMAGEPD
jgi:hypothetical protein